MANRYWVGGTASWDGTAGTKWAATSNGTGGETVPTTADDVFFDGFSTGTVTIATGNTGAKSINCTGFTGTITGTAGITVAGSITLDAGMTYTHTGLVTISGTGTLTTAGKTFSQLTINATGFTVTLGDALNMLARELKLQNGTFDTANYNVTCENITLDGTTVRTFTAGSSTISAASSFRCVSSTNLTFNSNTSQINITGSAGHLNIVSTGLIFYNVSFTSTSAGTREISGANTFNNLTLTASATGLSQLSINANQTVSGTFTCAGSSAIARGFVRSNTIGTSRTITAATVSADDCDFRDITIAGAAAPISPTRAGDCGGNSGITFSSKTVYWNLAGTQNWNATGWATTNNGTPAVNNFPLAQDTATFTDSGSAGTVSLAATYNTGTIDASSRTSAMTLSHNSAHNLYGSYTLGSGVTVSGTSAQTFSGRSTMTFTSAGKTITYRITVDAPGGTFQLGDAFTSSSDIVHNTGTFNANNNNVTCTAFSSSGTGIRTITMGSGLWSLSIGSSICWTTLTTTNLTFNKDTANILLSNNTNSSSREFRGGGLTFNKITIGGATATGTYTAFNNISASELASTKTVAHTININSDLGTITTWSVTGTSGNVVTLISNNAGSRRTFTLTNVTSGIDYLAVKDIGVTDANRFYVGANSTDNGNNNNVIFTAAPSTATGNFLMLM